MIQDTQRAKLRLSRSHFVRGKLRSFSSTLFVRAGLGASIRLYGNGVATAVFDTRGRGGISNAAPPASLRVSPAGTVGGMGFGVGCGEEDVSGVDEATTLTFSKALANSRTLPKR